jgi:hypothetical protein
MSSVSNHMQARELSLEEIDAVSGGNVVGFIVGYIATKLLDKAVDATEGNSFPRQVINAMKNQIDKQ